MGALAPLTVLLVDDDPDALKEMSEVLHQHSIFCESADDGQTALQLLQSRQDVGVVVTDLRMPRLSGFDMIESIAKDPALSDRILRFVIITGHGDLPAARRAIANGAIDFISKPASAYDIVEAVHRSQAQVRHVFEDRRRQRIIALWNERSTKRNRKLREHVLRLGSALAKRIAAQNGDRTDLMRRMSHEFRTPLHQILGLLDLLRSEDVGQNPEYISLMERAAKDLLALVENFLDLKNAEQLTLSKSQLLRSDEVLRRVIREFQELMVSRSVSVVLHIDPSADMPAIDQKFAGGAFRNVLNNAIHFAPCGSTVDVKVDIVHSDIRIAVSDVGKGMAKDEIALATKPFWQADQSSTRVHSGAGLGLTLASLYLDLLGGSLRIDSALEMGTTVTLIVPSMNHGRMSDSQ